MKLIQNILFSEKKIITLTRIAGYCASSTECSDHSLKKLQIFKNS